MFKVLLRLRLRAMLAAFTGAGRRKKGKSRSGAFMVLFAILMLYCVGVFAMLFAMCADTMLPLCEIGLSWFYFGMFGMIALALSFIGSVMMTQSQLYDAKDNELLLSMPVKPGAILLSRMVSLLLINLLLCAIVLAPCGVVYGMGVGFTAMGLIAFVLCALLLAVLALALSCILGWVVALIASKLRNKALVSTVFSLLFLAVYFIAYSKAQTYIQYLVANGQALAGSMAHIFPVWAFGAAAADGNVLALLGFAACALIPFALVYFLLSRSFVHIATAKRGAARKRYHGGQMAVHSPKAALLRRELKRFVSSAAYMVNDGFGIAVLLVGSVAAVIKRDAVDGFAAMIPGLQPYLPLVAIAAILMISAMNMVSAPSVSLEGKSLWIVQTMPVEPREVLMAKVYLHLVVCLPPTLLCAAALCFVLRIDAIGAVLALAVPAAAVLLLAALGVVLGVKLPNFDWTNEAQPVKQGIPVLLTMLAGFCLVLVPGLLYGLVLRTVCQPYLFAALYGVVLLLIDGLLLGAIRGRIARRFAAL